MCLEKDESPEAKLAALLDRAVDHRTRRVYPGSLRSVFADHWDKIKVLAHQIHDANEAHSLEVRERAELRRLKEKYGDRS